MKKTIALALFLSFVTWIVPLGAFIEAAKEKQICNGRRAICMCTLYLQKLKRMKKIPILEERKERDGAEALKFPSFGSDFFSDAFYYTYVERAEDFSAQESFPCCAPLKRSPDPVPRRIS